MRLSRERLQREATATGFRVEILEKVAQLLGLLDGFNRHPYLKGRLALKGGTALNLFVFDVPRLSIDIDLNYVGQLDREAMLAERARGRARPQGRLRACRYRDRPRPWRARGRQMATSVRIGGRTGSRPRARRQLHAARAAVESRARRRTSRRHASNACPFRSWTSTSWPQASSRPSSRAGRAGICSTHTTSCSAAASTRSGCGSRSWSMAR